MSSAPDQNPGDSSLGLTSATSPRAPSTSRPSATGPKDQPHPPAPPQQSKVWAVSWSLATMVAVTLLAVAWNILAGTDILTTATKCTGAGATKRAVLTCSQLKTAFPNIVTLPAQTQQYDDLRDDNWSHTTWQRPACIAAPTRSDHVSALVKTLVKANVPFAIRSGGHSPNPGDASIGSNGVLLSLHALNSVTYDAATGLVSIGPGARWGAVYDELDKYNLTAVGGRVMDVGVGGLSLGGGLSYLSDLHGFVCDNVVSYEVVLADGRVVEARADSHPDLFWALKGGSNNFGIVTRFKSRTYPSPPVWGGIQVFTADQTPALMHALYQYQTTPNKDPAANLIINLIPTNNTLLLTLVYLKPAVERPAVFAPFSSLTPIFEQTGPTSLHALMAAFPPATQPRWTWYVRSLRPDAALYADISAVLAASAPEVAAVQGLQAGSLVAAVQPVGASAVLAGRSQGGGNALGLEAVNQTWFSVSAAWWKAEDDGKVDTALRAVHAKIGDLVKRRGAGLEYVFMNDANARQDVIKGYGRENVARLWLVAKRYDPSGVFQRLVPGGQKLPKGW